MTEEERSAAVHEANRIGLDYQSVQQRRHGLARGKSYLAEVAPAAVEVFREQLQWFVPRGRVEIEEEGDCVRVTIEEELE